MDEVQKALRERYPKVHPLIWHRSVEYAKTNGELFDIMESMPKTLPIVWDNEQRVWVTDKLLQEEVFKKRKKK